MAAGGWNDEWDGQDWLVAVDNASLTKSVYTFVNKVIPFVCVCVVVVAGNIHTVLDRTDLPGIVGSADAEVAPRVDHRQQIVDVHGAVGGDVAGAVR